MANSNIHCASSLCDITAAQRDCSRNEKKKKNSAGIVLGHVQYILRTCVWWFMARAFAAATTKGTWCQPHRAGPAFPEAFLGSYHQRSRRRANQRGYQGWIDQGYTVWCVVVVDLGRGGGARSVDGRKKANGWIASRNILVLRLANASKFLMSVCGVGVGVDVGVGVCNITHPSPDCIPFVHGSTHGVLAYLPNRLISIVLSP